MATDKYINIKVDTGNSESKVNSLDSEMKDLGQSTDKVVASNLKISKTAAGVSTALNSQANSANKANSSIQGVSKRAGAAGIQFQQFIGQIQGGQSAMLALSQQAADLGIVLGAPLIGAIAGISASIGGLLLPTLFKGNDALKELNDNVDDLISNSKELNAEQKQIAISGLQERLKEQVKEFTKLSEATDKAAKAQAFFNVNRRGRKTTRKDISDVAQNDPSAISELTAQQVAVEKLRLEINETATRINDLSKSSDATNAFKERLDFETEILQQQLGLRQAVVDGFISQTEANEISRFSIDSARRETQFQEELLALGNNQIAKDELTVSFNENRLLREQEYQERLTELTGISEEKRTKLIEQSIQAENSLRSSAVNNAVQLFQVLGRESKAAALVGIAISKAQALGANAVATASGSTLAFAAQQVPGDPSSFARGTAAAAKVKALGAINAGLIVATGLAQGASALSGGGSSAGLGATSSGGSYSSTTSPAATESVRQTRAVDIRTDGSAFSEAVKEAALVLFNNDDDVVINITNQQQELVRTGAISG